MKRIDILKKVAEPIFDNDGGYYTFICPSMVNTILTIVSINLSSDNISNIYKNIYNNLNNIFPKFDRNIAIKKFHGTTPRSKAVWFNNNEDRIKFMKYLLDYYKDDEVEIEDILKELNIL